MQAPGVCLINAWQCLNFGLFQGPACVKPLVDTAADFHLDTDDVVGGGGESTADDQRDRQRWFAQLTTTSCSAMIDQQGIAVADSTAAGEADDDDFGQPVAYQTACGDTIESCSFLTSADCQYSALLCAQQSTCKGCLGSTPAVDFVQVEYTPSCRTQIDHLRSVCDAAGMPNYVEFVPCPETITINNRVVFATTALGALGALGSLAVFAVILGHDKDRKSLRERILVGVFVGNLVYALVNLVPIAQGRTASDACGDAVIGSAEAQAWARGLWFWGKYTMVAYELFVIYASVAALRTGSINMSWAHERLAHAGCIAVGIAAFSYFYFPAARYYSEYLVATDFSSQQAALASYDGLVSGMVRAWLGLLLLMLVLWAYQRLLHNELVSEIRAAINRAEEALMNSVFDGKRPSKSRELLAFRKQGYDEMARPLEAYVAVFIVFGFPALVMALDYCAARSLASRHTVSCQHICEMVLAVRTLATVYVYFRDPQCRAQLWDLRGLCRRLGQRLCGNRRRGDGSGGTPHRVGFAIEENEMRTIPGRFEEQGFGERSDPRPISAADRDVQMLGSSSFALLRELDDDAAAAAAAAAERGDDAAVGEGISYLRLDEP